MSKTTFYRHCQVALLRAAAAPLCDFPPRWPDLSDPHDCCSWLTHVWEYSDLADAIRHASPGLTAQIEAVHNTTMPAKQLKRITLAVIRYLLRIAGRQTPFGLFAGVASVPVGGPEGETRWGTGHRAIARAEAVWLADVIEHLEICHELLGRLDVVFTNVFTARGGRIETRRGVHRVTVQDTTAVRAVRRAAHTPVPVAHVVGMFPDVRPNTILSMLATLVQQGFLVTNLRAPMTVVDPLAHLIDRLHAVGAVTIAPAVLAELEHVRDELRRHNLPGTHRMEQLGLRESLVARMRALSSAGRTPLAIDLRLDANMRLPERLAHDVERAATVLARLSAHPTGYAVWRDFYIAFCDRFGTGTLVQLADVMDLDAGLGLPHSYPGSLLPAPAASPSDREQTLLVLAWSAWADGSDEIVLSEDVIAALAVGSPASEPRIPPHVELAVRVHANSAQAIRSGDYALTVAPARGVGTFTSRFSTVAPGFGLEQLYAAVPTTTAGALAVQLSFAPTYSTGENVCRVPEYLPDVLSLGEHRDGLGVIDLDDIAVTATREGLHLVSLSRRRVIEPQVFHALALDKQAPPLARFLAYLSRGLGVAWHEFDWGPYAERLPVLPRVRYGRVVLRPARWRLDAADLSVGPRDDTWTTGLERWRQRWRCPATVELRDGDRSLRLVLNEPAHLEVLHRHLRQHGHAELGEVASPEALGWAGGHVHEIAVPLFTRQPPAPPLAIATSPVVSNSNGETPGSTHCTWLYAKVFTHPARISEIIANHVPQLLEVVDPATRWWFVRYRGLRETDHVRLRLATPDRTAHNEVTAALGDWAQQLRVEGIASRLVLDTYLPEVGRYGEGPAMKMAENVFVADSAVVAAQLRHTIDTAIAVVVGMVDIVAGFFGDPTTALHWLGTRPVPAGTAPTDRTLLATATDLVSHDFGDRPGWMEPVAEAWLERSAALATYRAQLPAAINLDSVLESLLHMHHNRMVGIDRDSEHRSRRIPKYIALAQIAQGHP